MQLPFPLQADAGADIKATDPDKAQAHKSAKIILDTKTSIGKRSPENQHESTAAVKPDDKQRLNRRAAGIEIYDELLDNAARRRPRKE